MSSWTLEQLKALENAMAKGVLRVDYTDKSIIYRSLKEMSQLREIMRRDLGLNVKSTRLLATHKKGIC